MISAGGERDVAGFVLAGGQSSRMGTDKSLTAFAGRPLVAHALGVLSGAGVPAAIAGAKSKGLETFAPVIADSGMPSGPLSGICAALNRLVLSDANVRFAVFLPVDLPLLPPSLLELLLRNARHTERVVTLVSVNGFPQTFPAVVRADISPVLESELKAGRLGCYRAFETAARSRNQSPGTLPVEMLVQAGQVTHPNGVAPGRWFLNVNTSEDLDRADAAIRRQVRHANEHYQRSEASNP